MVVYWIVFPFYRVILGEEWHDFINNSLFFMFISFYVNPYILTFFNFYNFFIFN